MSKTLGTLTTTLLFSSFVLSQELDPDESKVWALEHSYYQYAKENNSEGYLNLFHENAIGWPTMDPAPKGKDEVSLWIPAIHSNPEERWDFEITLQAIESFGDVVVVHYILKESVFSTKSGREIRTDTFRIMHSWYRSGETWQIIAGMGGRQNAVLDG